MSALELAKQYLYELYNDADHVSKLAQCAQAALDSGTPDITDALDCLRKAERPTGALERRLRGAISAVTDARVDGGQ